MNDPQIEERGFFFPAEEPEFPNVTFDFPTIIQSTKEENNAPYISPEIPGTGMQPNGISGPRNMIPVFAKKVTEAISATQLPPEKRTFPTNPLFLEKIGHCSTVNGYLCIIRQGRDIGTTELEVFEGVPYSPWNEGKNNDNSASTAPYAAPGTGYYMTQLPQQAA